MPESRIITVSADDQAKYDDGIKTLRLMAAPHPSATGRENAVHDQLATGCPRSEHPNLSPSAIVTKLASCALVAPPTVEGTDTFLSEHKPFKPEAYAIARHIGLLVWETMERENFAQIKEAIFRIRAGMLEANTPIGSSVTTLVVRFKESLQRFLKVCLEQIAAGQFGGEDASKLREYLATLEDLMRIDQTELNLKYIVDVFLAGLENAIRVTLSDMVVIPEVFKKQFGLDIDSATLEEIALGLYESIALRASLHLNLFGALAKTTSVVRGQSVLTKPEVLVIGRNVRNQLRMAIRPEYLAKAKRKFETEKPVDKSPQLGCVMLTKIKALHDLIWEIIKPLFRVDDQAALEQFYRDMTTYRATFVSMD